MHPLLPGTRRESRVEKRGHPSRHCEKTVASDESQQPLFLTLSVLGLVACKIFISSVSLRPFPSAPPFFATVGWLRYVRTTGGFCPPVPGPTLLLLLSSFALARKAEEREERKEEGIIAATMERRGGNAALTMMNFPSFLLPRKRRGAKRRRGGVKGGFCNPPLPPLLPHKGGEIMR